MAQATLGEYTLEARVADIAERGQKAALEQGVTVDVR